MHYSSEDIPASLAYKLLASTIIPRPIALVTSVNKAGDVNAAPFSFFNAMGIKPPVVVLGFVPNADGRDKDTPRNILETGEFVVHIVDEPLAKQMNMTAATVPSEVDETQLAALQTTPSLAIAPPRLQAAPVGMECRLYNDMELKGGGRIIVGEVIHFHLRDDIIIGTDPLRIDIDKLAPISRLTGAKYARITDQFELVRPK